MKIHSMSYTHLLDNMLSLVLVIALYWIGDEPFPDPMVSQFYVITISAAMIWQKTDHCNDCKCKLLNWSDIWEINYQCL